MEIRLLTREELDQSLDLVWKVFCEYEAVNYTEDSRQVFYDAIHSKDYLDMLTAYGAFDESGFVGIIASRNKGSHVALFFVEGGHHRQGIGRKLWEAMLENSTADIITVHSSKYACEIYKKMGFAQIGEETEDGGIVYVPMEYLHFPDILHDEKPTVVRQSLNALKEVVVFRPELSKTIENELGKIDISGYKDSMIPLIKKDIAEVRELIEENDGNTKETI